MAKPLLGEEEKRAVLDVLESGMLAQGRKVAEFEQLFAQFIRVKHAIATSNGTTALHAALLAHDIGPGDEVITTPFSFIATANAIRMCGATPVFVDIEEKTFNLNPALIESAITTKTKAILPVHLFGLPAEMDKIVAIAEKHNLTIIEDVCQAHGAEFQGKKVGSFGTGCFSFYPTKNMTTGEGGMITTNDEELAKKIRKIINHGSEQKYYHDVLGYNYRMTDVAAAIGIGQLKKLESFNGRRKKNARYLTDSLSGLPGLILPPLPPGHVFHQYTIRLTRELLSVLGKSREEVAAFLQQQGIGTAIFYPLPLHKQAAYQEYHLPHFPVAEKVAKEVLSLPVHPALKEEELQQIVRTIKLSIQTSGIQASGIPTSSQEEIRLKNRLQRQALSPEEREEKSKIIGQKLIADPAFRRAGKILFYAPFDQEVSLDLVWEQARKEKKQVLFPAVDRQQKQLRVFLVERKEQLEPGVWGILEPKNCPEMAAQEIELVILPGLAFDRQGNRIGYGKGYYDALLTDLPAIKIALAYDFQLVDFLPAQEKDVPVDLIITENRRINCR